MFPLSRRWRRGGVSSVPARTRGHVEWARSRLCPAVPVGARWSRGSRGSRFPEDNWCARTMLTPKQEGHASAIASVLRDASSRRGRGFLPLTRSEPESQRSFTETYGSALGLSATTAALSRLAALLRTTGFKSGSLLGQRRAARSSRAVRKRSHCSSFCAAPRTAASDDISPSDGGCRAPAGSPSCCASPPP